MNPRMNATTGFGKYGKEENNKGGMLSKTTGELLSTFESILSMQTIKFTEKNKIVKRGISKDQLAAIKEIFELDYGTLSDLLAVTDRTLHLKKGKDTFSQIVSDRVMALVEVYSYGYSVFGDRELFHTWMKSHNRALGGLTPLEAIETHPGLLEVRSLIRKVRKGA